MKSRIDVLLVQEGLAETREKARRTIMAGLVFTDGKLCDKPGTMVSEHALIEVKGTSCPYVSRGGFKLEKALEIFGIDVSGKVCLDIGSSTGGFTDCMLQKGAAKVFAVDSGTNQLAWKIRSDSRVVPMERYNFRYASKEDFGSDMDFACCDVSFISLKHILPAARELLNSGAHMVCLIKPQFEAGREQVGKHGIVKDPDVHCEVIKKIMTCAEESGFGVKGLSYSPVKGAKGNIEYLIDLVKDGESEAADSAAVVAQAHSLLDSQE